MGYRSSNTNCVVQILPLRKLSAAQEALCLFLRQEAGRCWTDMLQAHVASRGGKWLNYFDLCKMFKRRYALNAQSVQALAQKLQANVDTARQLRKTDSKVRYPYRPKKYQTVVWKRDAIHRWREGKLHLSNGRKMPPLVLSLPAKFLHSDICMAELTWQADHYELCLTIDTGVANPPLKEDGYVSGVDLGEINIAALVTETGQGLIINGRAPRSIKRLRNKRHAVLTSRLSRCQPNSNRSAKLRRSKSKASAKFYAQQRDLLHKASRQVVNFCQVNHVKEIAVGDVRSIQNKVNLSKNANQKISQWAHGQFVHYLVYKARQYGIRVKQIAEDYSTRTCSVCGFVRGNAPQGRVYTCPRCSTAIHRDLNGASNICSRARYGQYSLIKVHNIKYLRPL